MKILVLGAGRMGLGAAYDLAHNSPDVTSVTVADIDGERARAVCETVGSAKLTPAQISVEDAARVIELMRGHDAAISCVTYFHNLRLARAAIEARTNFCDLGGNNAVVAAELALDTEARAAGINIIPDCGLAPGMVAVLAAHGAARFNEIEAIHIRVGGLPLEPKPPLNYQLVFSVEGLINEYVERARVVRDAQIVEVESMTEIEELEFPAPFGRMEAFQTSGGTSTLPDTFAGRIRELDYKTIRYPGHCAQFKLLVDLGLASSDEVDLGGTRVSPRKLLGELLVRHLPADEPDVVLVRLEFVGQLISEEHRLTRQLIGVGQIAAADAWSPNFQTVMRQAVGEQSKENRQRRARLRYDIIDRFDERTRLSAMMRTTAFPASIVAQTMARGATISKGALPQERCIPPAPFVAALASRGIKMEEKIVEG